MQINQHFETLLGEDHRPIKFHEDNKVNSIPSNQQLKNCLLTPHQWAYGRCNGNRGSTGTIGVARGFTNKLMSHYE